MQRIKLYSEISTSLSALSNEKLKQILADGKPMYEGIGGKSVLISINDTSVFVKKVPLTDLEQLPQHFMSTTNTVNQRRKLPPLQRSKLTPPDLFYLRPICTINFSF